MQWRILTPFAVLLGAAGAAAAQGWPQWGQSSQHQGAVSNGAQPARRILADVVYDPFTAQEEADPLAFPALSVHYQAPLVRGADVYMEFKTGTYTSLATYETQTWNEKRLHWEHGALVEKWAFASDWKPVPYGSFDSGRGPAWEPVFHAALAGELLYVPGAGGTVYKLDREDGSVAGRLNPFGAAVDPDIFLTGPITVDRDGNVYYDAVKLTAGGNGIAWDTDVVSSWLVRIGAGDRIATATYASLTPGAPRGGDRCLGAFVPSQLPWPPSPDAVPDTVPCGSQRPALNLAPAVAPDGTIYVASVAHLAPRTGYLLAVRPDLTPKWQASLRDRFHDGCNVLLPPNGSPGGCRAGAHTGVDPAQNRPGGGVVLDDSTASPTVAPDGSIFFGVYTRYNWAQGHLMKLSPRGELLASYPFGWDLTPAIFRHDGTYSVVLKDNHYDGGSYCNDDASCPPDRTASDPSNPVAFFITQLSKDLVPEWRYQNRNKLSCSRDAHGRVTCVADHPQGFEWCINAPAVDGDGVVYANSEDGNLYAIEQGGELRRKTFLQLALGAAYTPLAIGPEGRVYTENDGHLVALGSGED
jgi:outer membrane protein assembly factor BamB